MLAVLVLLPVLGGAAAWIAGGRVGAGRRRRTVGALGGASLTLTTAVAVAVALERPAGEMAAGPGWILTAEVTHLAGVVAVLVPAVALPVVVYAAAHEEGRGLARLVGTLTAFVGAMELLVVAGDLLTLLIAWELVGGVSWLLIAHDWRDPSVPRRAAHAFNATRLGDLGLFAAAGAAMAGVGSLRYGALEGLTGPELNVLVAGVVLAAVAKSAQGPFAPWLFSAMAGPTPVSALLHSATMVAAGAYLLARLQPVLDAVGWFAPAVIAVGLVTALAGGVVAAVQTHAKKLLAASTSAQYGLMLVAVGAGVPAAAGAHLVTHAALKALLFLAAGVAIAATGTAVLGGHRLGSRLRITAALSAVGALALAAVPPLGAAWTKEEIVAAAGHHAPWLAALVAVAGGLSALYAARFQLLAYGRGHADGPLRMLPGTAEHAGQALLAAATVSFGMLYLPGAGEVAADVTGGRLPSGAPWELVLSLALVAGGVWTAVVADRRGILAAPGAGGSGEVVADWLGLPGAIRHVLVDPSLRLATVAARLDDRVVDAGVRGAARLGRALSILLAGPGQWGVRRGVDAAVDTVVGGLARGTQALAGAAADLAERVVDGIVEATATGVGAAGRGSRRLQTGLVHHYYTLIAVGVAALVVVAAVWR